MRAMTGGLRRSTVIAVSSLTALLLVSCGNPPSDDGAAGASVDGFRYGDVLFARVEAPIPKDVEVPSAADVGRVVGRISTTVEGEAESADPFRQLEATVLPVGTEIHEVDGYPDSFRLAVRRNNEVTLYEAWQRLTGPQEAAVLLGPIPARTSRIGIYDEATLRPLAVIDGAAQVRELMGLLAQATVVTHAPDGEHRRLVLVFHQPDGSGVRRAFDAGTGYVSFGSLQAPKAFADAMLRASTS
jgi:hypothetical protein